MWQQNAAKQALKASHCQASCLANAQGVYVQQFKLIDSAEVQREFSGFG